jgi:hypothetical protein
MSKKLSLGTSNSGRVLEKSPSTQSTLRSANPLRQTVIFRDMGRLLLRRFPYAVFYRVYPSAIVVVACMHGRRDPLRWKQRDG